MTPELTEKRRREVLRFLNRPESWNDSQKSVFDAAMKRCQDATLGPGFKGTVDQLEKGGGTC